MKFSKIFVVNPPNPPGYVSNKDSMGGFGQLFPVGATYLPPVDLVYLTSYLAEQKVAIQVFECLGLELSQDDLVRRMADQHVAENGQSALVVVRTSLPTLDWDLSVCRAIKATAPTAQIAIYGPVVPHVLGRIKKEEVLDYIIEGEPDETVHELFTGGRVQEKIHGLTYRYNGGWQSNPMRVFNKNLDAQPFPKWEMLPYKKYTLPKSVGTAPVPFLPMQTSRGCPFGCHYCPYPVGQGLPFRYRSATNVVDEIEHLIKDLGIQYIIFRDPIFSLRQKRVLEICEEIRQRGLVFRWHCETRPDCLSEETIRAMAAAGCEEINFGVESAEVEIQANVGRKPITNEEIIETVTLCRRLGIKVFCFFIIGLPGDTVRTILHTIHLAIKMEADWIQFTAASPFVGTKLREWAVAKGLVREDEYAYINSHQAIIGNENLSKEQVRALLWVAQFIQHYLINRKGILKDDRRSGAIYRSAKALADVISDRLARTMFTLAKWRFNAMRPPLEPGPLKIRPG